MENLLLVFTRNPELGKVKTRLAASIGNENALAVYKILLEHTKNILVQVKASKTVLYSEKINEDDIWNQEWFDKKLQKGNDLGERMKNAFQEGFNLGFKKIVIVGSDLLDLEVSDLEKAFELLIENDAVIGPAVDGGYYLLGLKNIPNNIFENKKWSTNTVLQDTLQDLKHLKYAQLKPKNDIDTIDDIKNITAFHKYL